MEINQIILVRGRYWQVFLEFRIKTKFRTFCVCWKRFYRATMWINAAALLVFFVVQLWFSAFSLLVTLISVDAVSVRVYTAVGGNVTLPCPSTASQIDWFDYVHNNETDPIDIRQRIKTSPVTSRLSVKTNI
jgi:hypothetical protein